MPSQRHLKPQKIACLPLLATLVIGLQLPLPLGCKPSLSVKESLPVPLKNSSEEPVVQTPPTPNGHKELVIEVLGLDSQEGRARLALYRNAEGFNQPDEAWTKETLEIPIQGPLVWTVKLDSDALKEPQVRWAVSAHHDKNSNDKLDKSPLGIPTEPYGFSNNPKRGFGPPKFNDVSFSIDSIDSASNHRIEIKIQ
ncbi:MAG: DUF2141 domain-containing protein [Planctomycetota bacterium]